ncbi:hypothetical protein KIN20_013528 [Parelaphostrongylus tenuis]|uniref:Uncharacterized protein n=1 Tax=Parelaphostrongylus tenuis TaxID=148309 RepID=A0AAD5QMN3_PARTN|nr:hypothetical protein KIN20_013528 [Parelaphostrongylus tenuis]
MEPEFRQRYYRQESSSRSPPQVRVMKKRPTSLYSKLCDGVYGPVRSVGKQIRGRTRAAWNAIASNRYEIFVTLFLLLFVYLLSYFIMYTDPARTRKFIHSLPGNVYTWVTKLFFHKQK